MSAGVAVVTGITGQDGWYLGERLLADGYEVVGVAREFDGPDPVDDRIAREQLDVGEPGALGGLVSRMRPDLVVNLAAISSVAMSWRDPGLTGRVNALAVVDLLDAAFRLHESGSGIRVVQASSAEVFGSAAETPQSETTPIAPVSPYGAAKAYAHFMVQSYRTRGLFASNCILYNHESPRRPDTFVTRKITQGVARIARGLQDELVLGSLDARRDWGWAPDYADALLRVASAPEPDDFVVATGRTHSVADFVASAFRVVGIDDWERYVRVDPAFVRPADPGEQRGDAAKIRRELDWRPSRDFDEILAAMVEHDLRVIDDPDAT